MLARIKRNLTTGELEIQQLSGMSSPPDVIKYVTTLPVSPDIQDMIYAVAQASGRYKYYAGDEDNQTLQELGGSYDDTELRNRIMQVEDDVGTLANLETTAKTDLVAAINEIVPEVPSRPIVKVTTRKSFSSNTSELSMADVIAAGYEEFRGSYLVTVYRNTSLSMTYFIGWVEADSDDIYNAEFTKIGGRGDTLKESNYRLVYSGSDSSETTIWIFNPIGDDNVDI